MFYRINEKEFGRFLKTLREECNFTQNLLAEKAGIGIETIRRIEKGKIRPSAQIMHLLSITLKTDLHKSFRQISSVNSLALFYDELDTLIINNNVESLKNIIQKFNTYSGSIENSCSLELYETKKLELMIKGLEISYDCVNGSNEAMEYFTRAIKVDQNDFNINSFKHLLISHLDVRCIHLIAIEYNLLCEYKKSNQISYELLNYYTVRDKYNIFENSTFLKIKILLNISYNHHGLGENLSALRKANEGINYCIEMKTLYLLHCFYCRKAVALFHLDQAEIDIKDNFNKAITLMDITNLDKLKDEYLRIIKVKYGICLD